MLLMTLVLREETIDMVSNTLKLKLESLDKFWLDMNHKWIDLEGTKQGIDLEIEMGTHNYR